MSNTTRENVNMVSSMLNSFTFDEGKFCMLMRNEHRTLQQNFTRLCVEWLRTCARDDYRTDGRNEASHIIAKAMCTPESEELGIPFI